MSASQADLPEFFRRASFSASDLAELGLTEVQGGWTLPLVLSACGALLSALATWAMLAQQQIETRKSAMCAIL